MRHPFGKGCPIDWYFTGQPRKFWPCAVTGPLWQLCHLETIQSPPTRQAWSCIDRREGSQGALSKEEPWAPWIGRCRPLGGYGRPPDCLRIASQEPEQTLGAARGRLEAVLESVLEAVPRVRCKMQGFHELDEFLEFSILKTPLTIRKVRITHVLQRPLGTASRTASRRPLGRPLRPLGGLWTVSRWHSCHSGLVAARGQNFLG